MIETNDCYFDPRMMVFFDDTFEKDHKAYYKIYNDGSHFVGTRCVPKQRKNKHTSGEQDVKDMLFTDFYDNAVSKGIRGGKLYEYIDSGIRDLFPSHEYDRDWMNTKIKKRQHNVYLRKKRFRRKAYLNKWNYFVTFTYDDNKQDAESFRTRLRKTLSNFHTRRGWRYMGVFEHAPETGRLHFHGLFYIPEGQIMGKIVEKKSYSTRQKRIQTTHENTFFETYYGRNDFSRISSYELKYGRTVDYILKYMEKQGEKIVYSRGIPSEIVKEVTGSDIICEMKDFVIKYVMRDDVIEFERDVLTYNPKQLTMEYVICNRL